MVCAETVVYVYVYVCIHKSVFLFLHLFMGKIGIYLLISIAWPFLLLGQHGARGHHSHHLVGALENAVHTRVAQEHVHLVVLQVAVSTVQLQSIVNDLEALVRRVQLGHGTVARHIGVVLVQHVGRLTNHQAGGKKVRGHVCELELSVLEVGQGLVELLAHFDMLHCGLDRSLGSTQTAGAYRIDRRIEDEKKITSILIRFCKVEETQHQTLGNSPMLMRPPFNPLMAMEKP